MNPNLQIALFTTLSTIAQTLSAAMGLLGAIVLFALQETARSTERAARELTQIPHESMSPLYLKHLLTRRSFHELARHYGLLLEPGGSTSTSADALVHYSTLMWELDHDHALRRSFWTALLASGGVITYTLICCGLAPELAANATVGQAVLAIGLIGAVGCLVLYGFLLRVMLRWSPQEPIPTAELPSERDD
jgi:hypothetical protein